MQWDATVQRMKTGLKCNQLSQAWSLGFECKAMWIKGMWDFSNLGGIVNVVCDSDKIRT